MLEATVKAVQSRPLARPDYDPDFLDDVLCGLAQSQKQLSPKYFYDTEGSRYFDQICELQEYYPYRTELNLLPKVAKQLAELLRNNITIVEFGAGSLKKIQPLLDRIGAIEAFIPIDIAEDFLHQQCRKLRRAYPDIEIVPVSGDFSQPLNIPEVGSGARMGFFPGSTIGNFSPEEAVTFLSNAATTLGPHSHLLIGVDTKKSPSILHQAYNDSQNVTANFNLNVLRRINRELDGNFDLGAFEHYAFYNAPEGRVEMHLVSAEPQRVTVANRTFHFDQGESIHTECSYKYNPDEFCELAAKAQWHCEHTWMSSDGFFSLHLLRNSQE